MVQAEKMFESITANFCKFHDNLEFTEVRRLINVKHKKHKANYTEAHQNTKFSKSVIKNTKAAKYMRHIM